MDSVVILPIPYRWEAAALSSSNPSGSQIEQLGIRVTENLDFCTLPFFLFWAACDHF